MNFKIEIGSSSTAGCGNSNTDKNTDMQASTLLKPGYEKKKKQLFQIKLFKNIHTFCK